MNFLRDISLTRKLVYLTLTVAGVVLLLASAAFLIRDASNFRQQLKTAAGNRAELVARSLSAAVTFDNETDARDVLNYLSSDPHITVAAVHFTNGRELARYTRPDLADRNEAVPRRLLDDQFEADSLWVVRTVRSATGERVGRVFIQSDLTGLRDRLKEDILISFSVLLFSSLIALLLSTNLQRLISRPILRLAQTVDEVATRKDYSIRATKDTGDEIGLLVDRFNEMLAQIASRDDALHAAHAQLEERVAERTAQLTAANQTLRESETRFTLAFESNPLAMVIATLDEARILNVNDALLRSLGGRREQLIGKLLTQSGLAPNPDRFREFTADLLAGRPVRDREYSFQNAAGQTRNALCSLARIHLDKTDAALIIINDITERLSLEAQLRHSQKMEGIGQLAAGVAHDYNNILTVIQGHVEIILTDYRHDMALTESLTEVSNAAARATGLTRQLLAFSRRQVIQPRMMDLNEVVANMVKMLARVLGEHITLELHLQPTLPVIHADIGMIEQVITNLAVNSRDAMLGGGRLTFATEFVRLDAVLAGQHPQGREGNFILLRVSDTGCGMDAVTLAHVFEPFFTTKPIGKGTGLGLATAYGIVQQHRGWIEVSSAPGKGTEFRIYLPECEQRKAGGHTEYLTAPIKGGTETILLVEDEKPVRDLARTILTNNGYKILTAGDGPEALKVWAEQGSQIDLVFTDLVMPNGMTGRQLAQQLKELRPGVKIIYTSGYSVDVAGRDLADEPDFHFLSKPYNPPNLLRAIRNRLEKN